jgi:acetyltransferase-like isoleucine patch superfamily enzyme
MKSILHRFSRFFGIINTELRYRWRFAKLGHFCSLSIKRLVGAKYINIGHHVTIFWGARIEATCFYGGQHYYPQITIEDWVQIGQNVHLTCSKSIIIEKGTTLAANVTITDSHHTYENMDCAIRDAALRSCPVVIGQECLIFNGAVILPGTTIGRHCVVGANSVVKGCFDDNCVISGNPARVIKRYDAKSHVWVKV